MEDDSRKIRKIAHNMGISDEDADSYLHRNVASSLPQNGRASLYVISIYISIFIGLTYWVFQIIRCGLSQSFGIAGYATFCIVLISSKRFLEFRVGFYSKGIHFRPAGRPSWLISIIAGWILLLIPAIYLFKKPEVINKKNANQNIERTVKTPDF